MSLIGSGEFRQEGGESAMTIFQKKRLRKMQEGATEVGEGRLIGLKVRATGTGLLSMLTLLAVDSAACVSLVCF